ncbi:MAG: efflux RND transporter permease subunit [Erysipelotrichaceae bacterium]
MIEKAIHFLIKKRMMVLFIAFLVGLTGLYCYYVIPKRENPNTSVAAATIVTVYAGASPEDVESDVTDIIEKELATLDHIDYYSSTSMESASVIVIMYDMDVTIDEVETDLRQAVADASLNLPDLASDSVINTNLVEDNQFIISLSGTNYTHDELVEYAKVVEDIILDTKGIHTVSIDGEKQYQVVIEIETNTLKTYGLSLTTLSQLLQAQNLSIPSGNISYQDSTISVITPAVFESLQDIGNTVISGSSESLSFVKLKDVANIYIEEVGDYYYFQDGEAAVLITGTIMDGENAIIVGNELREKINLAKSQLPSDLIFHEAMYAPQDIEDSINGFIISLLQSIGLIIFVVMIGVRVKNAIVVSIALPLSILTTFITMHLLDIEFQFISIAALIVSLGILVDNALVMSEAIQFNLNKGIEKIQAIIQAVKTNAMPVFTSTLTTIVTFSIIYFIPGVVGAVAATIPTVVISTLIASYVVAMIIIPILAYIFFEPEKTSEKSKDSLALSIFNKALIFSLKHKIMVVVGAFLTLGISALLALQLGLQFFPASDKPILYVDFEGEAMSTQATLEATSVINTLFDEIEIIENYTSSVGGGLPSFFLTVPTMTQATNMGQYMLQLDETLLKNYGSIDEVATEIQSALNKVVSSGTATVKSLEYSIPTEAQITYAVSSNDSEKLDEVVSFMTTSLENIEGVSNVRDTKATSVYQYQVNLDSDVLSSYGLLKYDVLMQLNTALMGTTVGTYYGSSNNLDIVLRSNISSLTDLQNLQIVASVADTAVDLSQIATISLSASSPTISHYNGEPFVYVLSDVSSGYNSMRIESSLQDLLDDYDTTGVTITSLGEVSNMMDLISNLFVIAFFAVFLIYFILAIQFRNYIQALIILVSIPLSFIGCGLGLWLFNMDIQAMALIGLVSLFGIVVNNGILLLEVINDRIAKGYLIEDACTEALKERYRPILLSSTTTCIGLVPLILSGNDMTAPMAAVLLFGLLFSTVLTMVVIPTLYALLCKKNPETKHLS